MLRVPGPELNDGFGPSHQAGDGALRLNELLLLVLAERRMKDGLAEEGERRSLLGVSAPPTPTLVCKSYTGISRAEQTRQEDPAALTGWEEGSGEMGWKEKAMSSQGWDLSTTTPAALQSRMHTSGSIAARTRKHLLSKGKKRRTQHTPKCKSQEV